MRKFAVRDGWKAKTRMSNVLEKKRNGLSGWYGSKKDEQSGIENRQKRTADKKVGMGERTFQYHRATKVDKNGR